MQRLRRALAWLAGTLLDALWMFAIVSALLLMTQHSLVLRSAWPWGA